MKQSQTTDSDGIMRIVTEAVTDAYDRSQTAALNAAADMARAYGREDIALAILNLDSAQQQSGSEGIRKDVNDEPIT